MSVSVSAVTLAEGCIGCGRCSAACPTQALTLPELGPLNAPVATSAPETLRIECRKVPQAVHSGNTFVVPCLGALTAGHLLARQSAGTAVQIVDRGWCAQCEAGCGEAHPARAAVDAAIMWLEAVGEVGAPAFVQEPLPGDELPATIPPLAEEEPELDRRSFFRAVLERPAGRMRAAEPMGSHGRAAYPADRRHPSPERGRQLDALRKLAEAHDTTVPAEFFSRLNVDARCCDQRMCVAMCPTAALAVREEGGNASLEFSAERCIGCGTCVRACPESAMHLEPHGGRTGMHTLISHTRVQCTSCGEVFTPAHAADTQDRLCATCMKSRRFMNDARRQLFGAGN